MKAQGSPKAAVLALWMAAKSHFAPQNETTVVTTTFVGIFQGFLLGF